ncbi:hypothetical protein HUT19_17160 [Streptomyces sp. NA02950]|uniref:hypothetical protein n=1 Tax=Streptomyces sp. NA02950 TaxID=2742137 RepID=UPI0015926741|nr:hypothetical protein [Streptomyces sp. NA02950]QKV93276.1 hypothetical protein HUT19_17160 [Streptomyces sp. NA02950]
MALCAALTLTSCTGEGKGPEEKERTDSVPVAKLCASSLDVGARQALDVLSRDNTFKNLQESTFRKAASLISREKKMVYEPLCRVYSPNSSVAFPLFQVKFVKYDTPREWPDRLSPEGNYYRVGAYGASSRLGAEITFRCTGGIRQKGGSPFVVGDLLMSPTEAHADLPGAKKGQAGMAILMSVTRVMAEELGCLKEAGIPAGPAHPLPPTEYRRPPHSRKDWRWWWRNDGQSAIGAAAVAHDTRGRSAGFERSRAGGMLPRS